MKIDGKAYAQSTLSGLKQEVLLLKEQKNITPRLAVILVGDDPASVAYVNQKKRKGEAIGINVSIHHYKENVATEELLQIIERLNNDNNVHAIIIQQPLPSHIDTNKLVKATNPQKDVDGFHPKSAFTPPITEAVVTILTNVKNHLPAFQGVALEAWLKTKRIVIIGKGETGGAPIASKLKTLGVKPIILDSKTQNPHEITKQANIIISCVGKANILTKENIKPGVILLSIGMFRGEDGKLHGDYEEEEIKDIASYYTPVPGGIGPVNVAMLLKNAIAAAKK